MMTESTLPPLRVLSIGAGAIGTYIGGSLALNGSRVVFLEQPQVAQELRQRGPLVGTGEDFLEQLASLEQAGVQQVMLQWLDLDDIHGLEQLASQVLLKLR